MPWKVRKGLSLKAKRDKVIGIMMLHIQGGSSVVQRQEEPEEVQKEPEVINHLP